jgi:hypothetical protein
MDSKLYTEAIIGTSWNNDSTLVISFSRNSVKILDFNTKQPIFNIDSNFNNIYSVSVSNCKKLLLMSVFNTLIIIDIKNLVQRLINTTFLESPRNIRFSNNPNILLCLSNSGNVITFNYKTLTSKKTFPSLSSFQKFSTKNEEFKNIFQDLIF